MEVGVPNGGSRAASQQDTAPIFGVGQGGGPGAGELQERLDHRGWGQGETGKAPGGTHLAVSARGLAAVEPLSPMRLGSGQDPAAPSGKAWPPLGLCHLPGWAAAARDGNRHRRLVLSLKITQPRSPQWAQSWGCHALGTGMTGVSNRLAVLSSARAPAALGGALPCSY